MDIQTKKRGGSGRSPLPPEEALVGYGMHLRPRSLRCLKEVAAFRGSAVRVVVEGAVARSHAKMRSEPMYEEWVAAGRPLPVADWIAAGKPQAWDGKRHELESDAEVR